MPRRPRVDLAGFHHIINRGVNHSDIFVDDSDYEMFLQTRRRGANTTPRDTKNKK